jgi:S1-C subfamily serine protease
VAALPRRLQREHDLLNDRAVEVMEVLRGGASHAAGLRPGDLIVALSGRIVNDVDDLHQILSSLGGAKSLEVAVLRGERLMELTIEPRIAL